MAVRDAPANLVEAAVGLAGNAVVIHLSPDVFVAELVLGTYQGTRSGQSSPRAQISHSEREAARYPLGRPDQGLAHRRVPVQPAGREGDPERGDLRPVGDRDGGA